MASDQWEAGASLDGGEDAGAAQPDAAAGSALQAALAGGEDAGAAPDRGGGGSEEQTPAQSPIRKRRSVEESLRIAEDRLTKLQGHIATLRSELRDQRVRRDRRVKILIGATLRLLAENASDENAPEAVAYRNVLERIRAGKARDREALEAWLAGVGR